MIPLIPFSSLLSNKNLQLEGSTCLSPALLNFSSLEPWLTNEKILTNPPNPCSRLQPVPLCSVGSVRRELPSPTAEAAAPAPSVCVPGTAHGPSWQGWIKTSAVLQPFSFGHRISYLSLCPGVQVLLPCFCPALILPGYAQGEELPSLAKITLLCLMGSFFRLLP